MRKTESGSRCAGNGRARAIGGTNAAIVALFLGMSAAGAQPLGDANGPGHPQPGAQIAQSKCASCHGPDGNSTNAQIPKLAGQNPAYTYAELSAFHSGYRKSSIMSAIVASLSESEAENLASYYGEQRPTSNPVKDQALVAAGRKIFYDGTADATMSRCVMCHGSPGQGGMMGGHMGMMGHGMMMGGMADTPNLHGQHAPYLVDQLNRFASGERQGTVMNRIAASLTKSDSRAVAAYLSSRR